MRLMLLAGFAALVLAEPALACETLGDSGPVPVMWSAPPKNLGPDEVALEVVFDRMAPRPMGRVGTMPDAQQVYIADCRSPEVAVYKVKRVLAGNWTAPEVMVLHDSDISDYTDAMTPNGPPVLVGKLETYMPGEKADGQPVRFDPPALFAPRFPPKH